MLKPDVYLLRGALPVYLFCFVSLFTGCGNPAVDETAVAETMVSASGGKGEGAEKAIPLVTTLVASTARLPLRRQANGKLRARRRVMIKSRTSGPLLAAPIEGRYYKAGDLLLATDPRPLELARDRARAARDEAAFRRRDLLLRLRTNLAPADSNLVTELARENILIQSGLPAAEVALREAEFNLSLARLTAPFPGRAADVKVQAGRLINSGEEVCTLIDPNSLEAEFSLLEQEVAGLNERRAVFVTPVARPDLRLPAELDIINPTVDEGGLLRVRARLRGKLPVGLYPGMTVTVTLEGRAPTAVVLPKAAVVERSGRTLVFVYDPVEERAKWQYVTVAFENDEAVALGDGVEAGQLVIVGGNLTLDHDSPVRVDK